MVGNINIDDVEYVRCAKCGWIMDKPIYRTSGKSMYCFNPDCDEFNVGYEVPALIELAAPPPAAEPPAEMAVAKSIPCFSLQTPSMTQIWAIVPAN